MSHFDRLLQDDLNRLIDRIAVRAVSRAGTASTSITRWIKIPTIAQPAVQSRTKPSPNNWPIIFAGRLA